MSDTRKTTMSNKRKAIVTAILLIPLAIAGFSSWMLFNTETSQEPVRIETRQATLLPELRSLAPFSLLDHTETVFDNSRLIGQWTLLSFGYTHCPDICPSTLTMLAEMDHKLQKNPAGLPYQVGFVSIDPARDTTERLSEYVTYFAPDFLGITGSEDALKQLTGPLGILYRKVETEKSAMDYVMDHSASIILVDPQGRYRALFSPPHDPAIMADDLLAIGRAD
ncbi:MAG: SCO family protein [Candidatus Thiodiazotropha sp. (ex Monitilora ramsayi)]|nr:SCO family protein [Candidatus Thiodiazotropha sp. (ex Monitilora ramsayi)]